MKCSAFWDITPCGPLKINRRLVGTRRLISACCLLYVDFLLHLFFDPENGGDTFLRNVNSHKIYLAPHPRSRHSSRVYFCGALFLSVKSSLVVIGVRIIRVNELHLISYEMQKWKNLVRTSYNIRAEQQLVNSRLSFPTMRKLTPFFKEKLFK
jgi:hypothetical protein